MEINQVGKADFTAYYPKATIDTGEEYTVVIDGRKATFADPEQIRLVKYLVRKIECFL